MTEVYDVFISYSRKDVGIARQLHNLLSQHQINGNPIIVFRDERDLGIGEHVDVALPAAHRRSASVVVLWSDNSATSRWVYNEAISAVFTEKYLPLLDVGFNPASLDASLRPINAVRLAAILANPQPLIQEISRLKNRSAPMVGVMNRLPASGSEHLIGRKAELVALNEAWNSGKTRLFVLDAMGGTGKTALINHFLEGMADDNWRGAERAYCWSFYSQGTDDKRFADADGFFAETLEWFGYRGEEICNQTRRGVTLAELINRHKTLLVLDGLEPLQYPGNTPGIEGRLKDDGLAALFKRLSLQMNGMVIVTTRIPLPELTGKTAPAIKRVTLEPLTPPDGALLLKTLGVRASLAAITPKEQETELEIAVKLLKGHALSLNLLGTYALVVTGGILPTEKEIKRALVDPAVSEVGFVMMRRYEIMFENRAGESKYPGEARSAGRQLALLYLIGLFDRPAEGEALKVLLYKPIEKLTDTLADLRPKDWAFAVDALRNLKLLLPETVPGAIDAHPLVREYFGSRLRETRPEAFRAANLALYEHYKLKGLPEPLRDPVLYALMVVSGAVGKTTNRTIHLLLNDEFPLDQRNLLSPTLRDITPEGLLMEIDKLDDESTNMALESAFPDSIKTMETLFAAITHGCAAGAHDRVFPEVYLTRVARGNAWFLTKRLGAYGADLSALSHFFLEPFATPSPNLALPDQTLVISEAAYRLRALGRSVEAEGPMVEVLRREIESGNYHYSAIYAINLSEVRLSIGKVEAAVQIAEVATTYADRMSDSQPRAEFWRSDTRTLYANALLQAGRLNNAATLFTDAELRQAGWKKDPFPLLFSLRGARYCDFLLSRGEASEVQRRASETIKIAREKTFLLDVAFDTLSLGYAAMILGDCVEARARLDEAVDAFHMAGATHHIPRGYIRRAAFFREIGNFGLAEQDLNDAADIADRSALRLHQCDIALERSRLALALLLFSSRERSGRKGKSIDPRFPKADAAMPASPLMGDARVNTTNDDLVKAAIRYADKANSLIDETGYRRRLPDLALVRARIALAKGDREAAKPHLVEAKKWTDDGWRIHVADYEELSAWLELHSARPPACPND